MRCEKLLKYFSIDTTENDSLEVQTLGVLCSQVGRTPGSHEVPELLGARLGDPQVGGLSGVVHLAGAILGALVEGHLKINEEIYFIYEK